MHQNNQFRRGQATILALDPVEPTRGDVESRITPLLRKQITSVLDFP
jgi:hypothetical protein